MTVHILHSRVGSYDMIFLTLTTKIPITQLFPEKSSLTLLLTSWSIFFF